MALAKTPLPARILIPVANPMTAEELIRDMLDGFHQAIGDRIDVPAARGLTSLGTVESHASVGVEPSTICR